MAIDEEAFLARLALLAKRQDHRLRRLGIAIGRADRKALRALQTRSDDRLDQDLRSLGETLDRLRGPDAKRLGDLVAGTMSGICQPLPLATHTVRDAVHSAYALVIVLDDIELMSRMSDGGRRLDRMGLLAAIMEALKSWLLVTETVLDRLGDEIVPLAHLPPHVVRHHYARQVRRRPPPDPPAKA